VSVNPLTIDFGRVVVHSTVTQMLTITNTSICPITLSPLVPEGASASLFTVTVESGPENWDYTTPIPPNGAVSLQVSFSPTQLSTTEETATLVVTYAPGMSVDVGLKGLGVSSGLCVNPTSDFKCDHVPLGNSITEIITVENCANEPIIVYAYLDNSGGGAFTIGPCPAMANCQQILPDGGGYKLNPGDQLTYPIVFTPSQGQGYEGSFVIQDGQGDKVSINLCGGGGGPEISCQTVPSTPPPLALMLDFGQVVIPDGGAVQSVICTNTGNDITLGGKVDPTSELQVAQSGLIITQSASSFSAQLTLAGLDTSEVSLRSGEQFVVQVAYDPTAVTPAGELETGTLQIQSNATLNPTVFVSLTGEAVAAMQ
jgi:hypothetical protein